MKISHHLTSIVVVSLLSIAVFATAIVRSDFSLAAKAKQLASGIYDINATGVSKNTLLPLPRFSAGHSSRTPVVAQATGATLPEIEVSVDARLTLISSSGQAGNTLAQATATPFKGKMSLSGGATTFIDAARFSAPFPSNPAAFGQATFNYQVTVNFPSLAGVAPIVLKGQFTLMASGSGTVFFSNFSIDAPTTFSLQSPELGLIEVVVTPRRFPIELGFTWKKGLNDCGFPSITQQPSNITVCESSPATMTVAATGNGTLQYQWRKNQVAIPGATSATLKLDAISVSDAGTYEVIVADSCGPIRSTTAFLGVVRPGEYSTTHRLLASDAVRNGRFGNNIAVSGNTIASLNASSGLVYIFTQTGNSWQQEAILKPADKGAFSFSSYNNGLPLVLDGDTLAASEQSDTYVFTRTGTTWTQQAKIAIPPPPANTGYYIYSTALQGDVLVQGIVPNNVAPGSIQGLVRVFRRVGQTWNLETTLTPNDGTTTIFFGDMVALSGNRIAIGATNRELSNNTIPSTILRAAGIGAVYIFERGASGWTQTTKVNGKQTGDSFGSRLALDGNTLFVGSYEQIVTNQFGALYTYQNQNQNWVEQQKLALSISQISLSSTKLLVGNQLYTRNAQGLALPPKELKFSEFSYQFAPSSLLGEKVIWGISSYNAGANLEGAGAVFVTAEVTCGNGDLAVITSHPQNQQVADQLPAGFRIAFEQSSAISGLQWQVSTDGGNTYTDITGATRAELAITPDSPLYKNNNRFRVIIISTGGRITSDAATLTISATLSGFTTTSSNGLPVAVNLGSNTSVVFSNVTKSGTTTVKAIPLSGVTLPGGATPPAGSLAFDVTTTATFTGPVTLTFNVPTVNDPAAFAQLRVYHGEGTPVQFADRTVLPPDAPAPNYVQRQISARVTSLSPFVIAALTTPPPTGCAVTQLQQPTNYPTADTPAAVAHGDFNGDGKPDLVTANYEANAISVLLNNGTGRFAPAVNYNAGGNPKAVTVGDLNGDNKLDLVVANLTSFDLSVFLGKGDGTFTTAPRVAGMNYPTSVALGDFNNDGKVDLVVANSGSFLTTVMYGNGDGTFAFGFDHFNAEGGMPFAVTTGDFNKDGRADFAVAFNSNGKLGVYLNLPGGFVSNLTMFPAGNQPIAIAAGDFNGDGTDDVAVANYGSNDVTVVTNLPAGGTVTTIAVGSWPETLATTDLNGDKAKDLIVGNAGTNFVSLLTATSGGSFTRQDVVGVESPSAVAATDFNGDGKVDVIVADYWVNRLTTYQGVCASAFAMESQTTRLKTLRVVPSKYDGYPHARNTDGRRSILNRSR